MEGSEADWDEPVTPPDFSSLKGSRGCGKIFYQSRQENVGVLSFPEACSILVTAKLSARSTKCLIERSGYWEAGGNLRRELEKP